MRVKVFRWLPEREKEPHYDEYQVDFKAEDRKTVMDLLTDLAEQDPTLAFFSHSACGHGICGRCGLKVNGQVKLACLSLLTGEDLVLEPVNDKVARDLAVRKEA